MSTPFIDGPTGSTSVDPSATPQAPAGSPDPQTSAGVLAAPAVAPVAPAETSDEETPLEQLPSYWQKQIRGLRSENAKRRVGDDSDLTNRISELETKLQQREAEVAFATEKSEKTQILVARGLDPKFLPMVVGANADEWGKAADSLVELRGSQGDSRPDPVQVAGQSNTDEMDEATRAAQSFFSPLDK